MSRSFFEGQPVVYDQEGKGTPALGVVRAVFPAAAAAEALYTVETACVCDHCRAPAPRSKCARCKAVWYCGRGCQSDGWKVHQRSCGAGAGGGGAPAPTRTDKGGGIVVVEHVGVPAASAGVGPRPRLRRRAADAAVRVPGGPGRAHRAGPWRGPVEGGGRDGDQGGLGAERAPDSMDDPKYERMLEADPWARSFEAFCETATRRASTAGWSAAAASLSREEAQLLTVFASYGGVLAAATREARPDYAGLTHAYYNLLVRLAAGADPAPDCYRHLQDTTTGQKTTGLQDEEPGWAALVRAAVAAAAEGGAAARAGCTA